MASDIYGYHLPDETFIGDFAHRFSGFFSPDGILGSITMFLGGGIALLLANRVGNKKVAVILALTSGLFTAWVLSSLVNFVESIP